MLYRLQISVNKGHPWYREDANLFDVFEFGEHLRAVVAASERTGYVAQWVVNHETSKWEYVERIAHGLMIVRRSP